MTGQHDVDTLAVEKKAANDWAADPAIRREFLNDFESFVSFRRAEAMGLIHFRRANIEGGAK